MFLKISVYIVNFVQISYIWLAFSIFDYKKVNAGRVVGKYLFEVSNRDTYNNFYRRCLSFFIVALNKYLFTVLNIPTYLLTL